VEKKTFLSPHGFPVTPFGAVNSLDELRAAVRQFGCPAVLKTADFGYDGKGQCNIKSSNDVEAAWNSGGGGERIYETFVDFQKEVSVVAARGADGAFAHWGVIENTHENHILSLSVSPAGVSDSAAREAVEIARGILEKLDVIGVLCVEFFLTKDGKLLVNELAPRPHNSGHLTIDEHVTSQF
jgi:5-(carboxyamino)imidazole ribonucleotide synthase